MGLESLDSLFARQETNIFDKWFPHGIASHRASHALTHPWIILDDWQRNVIYAWQRVFRGWDDTVVWSIDYYLSEKIPQWVMTLKKDNIGVPSSMFKSSDWDDIECKYIEGAHEEAIKKWHSILDQIALGFECYYLMQEEGVYPNQPGYDELMSEYEKGFDLFREHFSALWD